MDITVYTTPTCPHCRRLKKFLDENNIEYQNFNVGDNKEKAQEMIDKSGQMGVPVIDMDGQIIIGFNKDKIKELLNIK
ncbi:MAG: glutaredoxin family protein [Elusimicrobiota bacterium]